MTIYYTINLSSRYPWFISIYVLIIKQKNTESYEGFKKVPFNAWVDSFFYELCINKFTRS